MRTTGFSAVRVGALDTPARGVELRTEDSTTRRQSARLATGNRLRHAARAATARVRRLSAAKRVHRHRPARHGRVEPRARSTASGALLLPIESPRFRVLDSVDPDAVRSAMDRAGDTLFVLASKSGSTIEPNVMAEEARRRVIAEGHTDWGKRFVAITDPDTALHTRAVAEGFRDVFVNPPDIGGRYSALSLFGMVPAALMGLDVEALLAGARSMEQACRIERASENPGLALGALMGAGARERPGQVDALGAATPAVIRSVGRATGRREHGQARQGSRARNRRAGGRTAWRRSHRRRALGGSSTRRRDSIAWRREDVPHAQLEMSGCRGTRRRVPPLGSRDGDRRAASRHQPLRRTKRSAGQGRHAGVARSIPSAASASFPGDAWHVWTARD